jgi:hypothetical protein
MEILIGKILRKTDMGNLGKSSAMEVKWKHEIAF